MSTETLVQEQMVTLINCADEPIHVPGTVQPHGAMLVFDERALLEAWTSNVAQLLLLDLAIGMPLASVAMPEPVRHMVEECVAFSVGEAMPLTLAVEIGGREFDCVTHCHCGRIIVEFELRDLSLDTVGMFALKAHSALDRLKRQTNLTSLMQMATDQVREITGFDRVMGYRFCQDGSGDVIAESRSARLVPLLGMRYPASDIPEQARRLYVMNTLRLIPDVNSLPVPLVGREGRVPVDMSHCVLRSVSPVHIEYLRNMGIGASMSVSVIVDGRLWGLIACHHMSTRRVPYAIRMTADVIAQVLAATVQTLEAQRHGQDIARAVDMRTDLMQSLLTGDDPLREMISRAPAICAALDCPVLIITQAGRHFVHGDIDTPTAAAIARAHPAAGDVFLERLSVEDWPDGMRSQIQRWPGMLAICFDPQTDAWLLAMRPEQVASIRWAGKPEKILNVGPMGARLTPRGSFDEWLETVRGRAEGWSPTQVIIARQMQEELHRASIARQAEIDLARAQLMAMLGHDLREPLHAIQMAAALLLRGGDAAPMGLRIQTSSNRMSRLISQVLDISKIQTGIGLGSRMCRMDLVAMLTDVVNEAIVGYPELVYRLLASGSVMVDGDADRLAQVVSNLLSNARSHGLHTGSIDVVLSADAQYARMSISNVSHALDKATVRSLYQPFKTASQHNVRNRGGMGLGLYITEQIVTEHGGTIAYSHAHGRVTFTVSLPLASV